MRDTIREPSCLPFALKPQAAPIPMPVALAEMSRSFDVLPPRMTRHRFSQGHPILVPSRPFPDPLARLIEREASSIRDPSLRMYGHHIASNDVRCEAWAMFSPVELQLHVRAW